MDEFWDDMHATAIYQMELNEETNPTREFFTLNQATEYLKIQFADQYFDAFEIVELMQNGELDLRVAFKDEIALAEACIKEGSYFRGDYGFEYKVNAAVVSHNPLSAFEVKFTSSQGDRTLGDIYQIIRGNFITYVSTKYDVLLFRNGKYWKVVDAHFDEISDELENYPKCFLQNAMWVVSAQSVQNFGKKRIWDALPESKKYEEATKAFAKRGNKTKAAEELGVSRPTLDKYLKVQPTNPIKHLIRK